MRFDSQEELDRYYREKFDAETEGMTPDEKLERAVKSRSHAYWFYGQRWDRLRELVRGTDLEDEACAIMANGTASPSEPPTASQQFHMLEHDLAKARLALRNCLAIAARLRRRASAGELADLADEVAHIERFCADAGVKHSILRSDSEPAG